MTTIRTDSPPDPIEHAAQLIYGAPNISPGEDWRGRSLRCWLNLATREEGLSVTPTPDGPPGDRRTWCGNVRVNGALFAVHRGTRPRPTTVRTQWTARDGEWVATGLQEQPALDPAVYAVRLEEDTSAD